MASKKTPSKTRISKCGYCNEEMLDQNLAKHCQDQHNSPKFVAGEARITSYFGTKSLKRKLPSPSVDPENIKNLSPGFDCDDQQDVTESESSSHSVEKTLHTTRQHHSAISSSDKKIRRNSNSSKGHPDYSKEWASASRKICTPSHRKAK